MDDAAHEWCQPTAQLTKKTLASLVMRAHRTTKMPALAPPVERAPVYPTYPGSPTLARLTLLALAALVVVAAMWLFG